MSTRFIPTGTISEDGSSYCQAKIPSRLAVSSYALLISTLSALLVPSVAFAATLKQVFALGKQVGTLNVSDYTAVKTTFNVADDNQPPFYAPFATATIEANFAKDGIESGGETILRQSAPQGLTYMQTLTYATDQPLEIPFQRRNGGSLFGTFADPPQGGYSFNDELKDPKPPWYGAIEPSGKAGDVPPTYEFPSRVDDTKKFTAQFADQPSDSLIDLTDDKAKVLGLANLFNGKDGTINFETTLVGVSKQPPENELLTGTYEVAPFQTFTWGLEFDYVDDGKPGFTADDYTVTTKDLLFQDAPSDAFIGAFDQKGDNADIEWKVNFVKPVPEPSSILGSLAAGSLGLRLLWKKRQRVVIK